MIDLEMIEAMEDLLAEATTHAGTERGLVALQKAAYLWQCFADGVRAGIACAEAMTPAERDRLRDRLLVDLLVTPRGTAN